MWMDLETSEVSQTEKEKYLTTSLICRIFKEMIQMNVLTTQQETHRFREGTYGWQSGKDDGRGGQEVWDGHVLYGVFKMDSQQGPTVQHMELCWMLCGSLDEAELGGEWIHVYVWLSPFPVHLLHCEVCN